MIELLLDPAAWAALVTLTALEIVLGVDNVIFISILASKLPAAQQPRARRLGLFLAMFMRIALLFSITWLIRLTAPLFGVLGHRICDEAEAKDGRPRWVAGVLGPLNRTASL